MGYQLNGQFEGVFVERLLIDDDHLIDLFDDFVQFAFGMGDTPEEVVEDGKGSSVEEVAVPFEFCYDCFLTYIRLHPANLLIDLLL